MSRWKLINLALIFGLGALLTLFPASLSADGITLNPTSGPVGTMVTMSGTIDVPNTPFTVYWNFPGTGIKLVEGSTGSPTPLSFSVTFTIPEDHYGRHSIYIYPLGARDVIVAPAFTITPSLFLEPKTATPGGSVTVTGYGFAANDTAEVTFDGIAIKSNIQVNSSGTFTTSVTIPEATAGPHIIRASGTGTPAQEVPPLTIDIKPVLTVSPSPAEVGKPITLTGKGFSPGRTITIKYNGNTVSTDPSPLKTDSSGTFTAKFTLPLGTSLKPAITATDTAGNTATIDMTLFLERNPPPPPVPISPTGRVNWFGSTKVTFTWKESTDPSGVSYTLEVAKDLSFFPPYLRRSALTQPEYTTDEKLPPGTYYWRVKAIDGAGNESQWIMAPHAFTVGFFPFWSLVLAGAIGAFLALWLLIRLIVTFFRWLRSLFYY